jgi:hypothetical protein
MGHPHKQNNEHKTRRKHEPPRPQEGVQQQNEPNADKEIPQRVQTEIDNLLACIVFSPLLYYCFALFFLLSHAVTCLSSGRSQASLPHRQPPLVDLATQYLINFLGKASPNAERVPNEPAFVSFHFDDSVYQILESVYALHFSSDFLFSQSQPNWILRANAAP